MKISDSSLVKRRVSYCKVASTTKASLKKTISKDLESDSAKNTLAMGRKSSWTQSSIFANTEAST